MQKIINSIQAGDITDNNLLQALLKYGNESADQFNEVCDELEKRNTTLEEQSNILEKQHMALQKQDNDKKTFIKNEESLKKQSVTFQLENQTLKHQLQVMKKEAKAAKEQTARNKASIKQRDAKIKKLEKKPVAGKPELSPLTTVYCKGEDVLLIYPSRLTIGVNGEKKEQVVLLYTNRKGSFATCFLDNNNEVAFSTFINDSSDISLQTKKLIEKNCMQVSDEAAEFAQTYLYRVNVIQGMKMNPIDFTCFD